MNQVLELIQSLNRQKLLDENYLEHTLIPSLGLNNENLNEQPKELQKFFGGGLGLRIWQYPNQFSKYLKLISQHASNINSYLEIGCRHGGTFVLTCEYIKALNTRFSKATAVDIIDMPPIIKSYIDVSSLSISFMQQNSQSKDFKKYLSDNFYDLIFIDGDHSYDGVKKDAEVSRNFCNVQVFHDTTNQACEGVGIYWNEFKNTHSDSYYFYDFTDQYDSVDGTFLGIGVAVRKQWVTI